ncbi:hypothetical protein EPN28_04605 [Patescibacteria group bacterium]|nr:MAG: hypothetical protein EPN28_04605 [Patescibacteria group bacterium]
MENEKKLDDILEIVSFIKDNAVTKTEFNDKIGGLVAKKEFDDSIATLVTKKDFNELTLDVAAIKEELRNIKADLDYLKTEMQKIAKMAKDDIRVISGDFDKLEQRIKRIEEHLRLQPAA